MVFDGAVAVTQRTGGRRRDYRAERAAREPWRIDREPCSAVGKLLAQLVEPDAGFRGGRKIGRLDCGDTIEPASRQRDIGRRVALQPGSRALDPHAPALLMRGAEEQGDGVWRAGRDTRHAVGGGL